MTEVFPHFTSDFGLNSWRPLCAADGLNFVAPEFRHIYRAHLFTREVEQLQQPPLAENNIARGHKQEPPATATTTASNKRILPTPCRAP